MSNFDSILMGHARLQDRASYSRELIQKVKQNLRVRPTCNRTDLCIYAAGSLARNETGKVSDLDLFFLSHCQPPRAHARIISRLGEIQIFADLIRLNEDLGLEPFSGDGLYLKIHEVDDVIDGTGSSEDDSENLFTTRLLLLLESTPLAGELVYEDAINRVLDMYFRDGRGRKGFRPLFLLNDILRYWRTLCLNYERDRAVEGKPWWKRNLNLKFPRKLTVYSTVLTMIASQMSTAEDFKAIVSMTPMKRLAFALDRMGDASLEPSFSAVLDDYEAFLAAKSHQELAVPSSVDLADFSAKAQRFDDFLHAALASPSLDKQLVRYVLI